MQLLKLLQQPGAGGLHIQLLLGQDAQCWGAGHWV
jgi:hypothetical protein